MKSWSHLRGVLDVVWKLNLGVETKLHVFLVDRNREESACVHDECDRDSRIEFNTTRWLLEFSEDRDSRNEFNVTRRERFDMCDDIDESS